MSDSMTIKESCKCGAEFYISFCGHFPEFTKQRYKEFHEAHKECMQTKVVSVVSSEWLKEKDMKIE